jgi:hypothetical protein
MEEQIKKLLFDPTVGKIATILIGVAIIWLIIKAIQRNIVDNIFKVESYPKLLVSDKEGKIRLITNGLGERTDDKLKNTISINDLRVFLDDLVK